jgi:hypothetical protein
MIMNVFLKVLESMSEIMYRYNVIYQWHRSRNEDGYIKICEFLEENKKSIWDKIEEKILVLMEYINVSEIKSEIIFLNYYHSIEMVKNNFKFITSLLN